jgi:hypothetical protein
MSPSEARRRLTLADVRELLALERLEGPVGAARGDLQAGVVAATVVNANPYRGKDARPVTPDEFVPDWDGSRRERRGRSSLEAWRALGRRLKERREKKGD